MKHKWAKEAIAFFSGETIQIKKLDNPNYGFRDWVISYAPPFDDPDVEFRIKPKEVVMYKWAALMDSKWVEFGYFFKDEESFRKSYRVDEDVKRLDYTATSFPVEK